MGSPFFGSTSTVLEIIHVDEIINLYKNKLGIDVSSLFGSLETIKLMSCDESGLLYFEPCIAGDAVFYEQLQSVEHYYMDARPEFFTAQKYIHDNSVLEVGCGIGNFSGYTNKSAYIGLELNPKAVLVAVSRGIDVREQLLDEFIKSNTEKFDVVCSFQVLEHVSDIHGFIESCVHACKDEGHIIFSLPAEDSFMNKAKNHFLNMPPHHVSLWPDKVFPYIAKKYNLDLVELKHEPMEEIHKLWFFKVVFKNFLNSVLGRKRLGRIDVSIIDRVLDKLSAIIGWGLRKVFNASEFYPAGHTVTAVYRKRV